MERENNSYREWIAKAVIVFTLALGINRFWGMSLEIIISSG